MLHTALRLAGLALPDLPVRRFAWVYDHDAAAI
jgi:hypothetical protein